MQDRPRQSQPLAAAADVGGREKTGRGVQGRGEQVEGVRTYQAQSAGPVLFPWSRDNEQWGKKLGVS